MDANKQRHLLNCLEFLATHKSETTDRAETLGINLGGAFLVYASEEKKYELIIKNIEEQNIQNKYSSEDTANLEKPINSTLQKTTLEEKEEEETPSDNIVNVHPIRSLLEIARKTNTILNAFSKGKGFEEKFSEDFVKSEVKKLLNTARQTNSLQEREELFNQLINKFENYQEWRTVYIPLEGIELEVDTLELGNVSLGKMTNEIVDKLTQDIWAIIDTSPEAAELKESHKKSIQEELNGYIYWTRKVAQRKGVG